MTIQELAALSAFPNTFIEGAKAVTFVLDEHIPSLTDEDGEDIEDLLDDRYSNEQFDVADLAVRTCACGASIDGFYEYVSHLKSILKSL